MRREAGRWRIGRFNFIVSLTFLPETKGKRLEDIQAYFQARVES
jgi:hypothetical protein